jgi:methionyl-tRNA formyltransferase
MHKLVFFGTSAICLPFLEELHKHFDICLIVTQPDAKGGRKRQVLAPAVKTFGLEKGIEVIQPPSLKENDVIQKIASVGAELGVVIAYGNLIPKRVFRLPTFRTVNVHFSLLPLYRGAAPVQRALEQGETVSGITIFEIVKKLDAGPIWAQMEVPFQPHETTADLWKRMSEEGAPFLKETVNGIIEGRLEKVPQDHEKATHAAPIEKSEGFVDWALTARQIIDKLRAFTPWPGVSCEAVGKRFKFLKLAVSQETHRLETGVVLGMDKNSLRVCCGGGSVLEVIQFQPQGKKPMTPYEFCRGNELPERLN